MEIQPILARFLRKVIGQWRFAKQNPTLCMWRGGVRPCCVCSSITWGQQLQYAMCATCSEDEHDRYSQPSEYDEYNQCEASGPCNECGAEIQFSDWACYGYCSRHCAVYVQNQRERYGGRW